MSSYIIACLMAMQANTITDKNARFACLGGSK